MTIERVEFHGATTYLYGRIGEQEIVARGDKVVGQAYSGLIIPLPPS